MSDTFRAIIKDAQIFFPGMKHAIAWQRWMERYEGAHIVISEEKPAVSDKMRGYMFGAVIPSDMTPIEQAITEAITAGWHPFGAVKLNGKEWTAPEVIVNYYHQPTYLLDPSFWQALGKARGWKDDDAHVWGHEDMPMRDEELVLSAWENKMHDFIHHLAEGKDANSFFANLK